MQLSRLKVIRDDQALSMDELSRRSGVSKTTIVRAEKGEPTYTTTVRKLARALGVTPAELRGDTPAAAPPQALKRPAGPTLERARELAARYRAEGDIDEADHWERIAERVATAGGDAQ